MAVVVLPTPPFWFTTARTLDREANAAGTAGAASDLISGGVSIVVREGYREVGVVAMRYGL
jgi:hypothetical protein